MSRGDGTSIRADLVYDVGMHAGEDARFYLAKGFRVVGFEADPRLVATCRRELAAALDAGRLEIVEGAVVDTPTDGGEGATVTFYRNEDHSVWGTVRADWVERNRILGARSTPIQVPAVDFAASLRRHGMPYYLKIDIEGADLLCLRALEQFETRPMYVSIESEKVDFAKLEAEFELLLALGYNEFQAVQQATVPRQREPRQTAEGTYTGQKFRLGSSGLFGRDLPGPWRSAAEVLREYEKIFRLYERFGDRSAIRRYGLHWPIQIALLRSFPGWYDTHARRR